MAAIIFRNFRVTAARGFSQVASKYRTRLLYDPTYRLASFAVDQYNKKKEKEVLVTWSSRRIFTREVSHVSHKDGTSLIDAPISCLGSFAVDKYNRKEKANLKFVEVVDVNSYMVEGISYDVTLKAKDGEKMNFYKANIWVRPWLNKEELTEFRLAVDPTNELACFAIDEYNKKENGNLKFVKCLYFKMYSVVGELYHITLEAKDGENVNVYKAEVRERLYQQKGFLLTEFKLDGDASSVDSEKCLEFKSALSSIFLNLKAKAASIWAAGFSQTEQSCKDLTTTTKEKKLNPIDPPTTNNLARFAVYQHNIKNKKNANLKFVKGIDSKRLSNVYIYHLTLEANDGEKVNVYQASIWERPCLNSGQLSQFHFFGEAPLLS